ncbi:MAG: DUF1045 domain-containing protein [Pseudomonadota bacterium]
MQEYTRFAIFYLPPPGSDLARFGAAWLGWDVEAGAEVPHTSAPVDVAALTATPRKYGFHGTLKAPFRLSEGRNPEDLQAGLAELAAGLAGFDGPTLALRRIGRFIALVPSTPSASPSAALADLAASCVQELDTFRAALDPAELVRRRAVGLTPAQDALLTRWGYPFVLDEFRFHLTLTGALDEEAAVEALSALRPLTRDFTGPLPVHEICLCGELPCGRFRLIRRYPLAG